jgi:hypothetical protein
MAFTGAAFTFVIGRGPIFVAFGFSGMLIDVWPSDRLTSAALWGLLTRMSSSAVEHAPLKRLVESSNLSSCKLFNPAIDAIAVLDSCFSGLAFGVGLNYRRSLHPNEAVR